MRPLSEILDRAGFFDLFKNAEWKKKIMATVDTTFQEEGYLDVVDDITVTEDPAADTWETCLARTTIPFDLELVIQDGIETLLEPFQRIMSERGIELSSLVGEHNFFLNEDAPGRYDLLINGQKYTVLKDASRNLDLDNGSKIFEGIIHAMNKFLSEKYSSFRLVLIDMYQGESMFLVLADAKMCGALESIKDEVSNAIFYLKDGESHL